MEYLFVLHYFSINNQNSTIIFPALFKFVRRNISTENLNNNKTKLMYTIEYAYAFYEKETPKMFYKFLILFEHIRKHHNISYLNAIVEDWMLPK